MSEIELLTPSQAPLLARPYFRGESTSPIAAALAQVPEFLEVTMPFIGAVLGDSSVPARIKEIVVLRVSVRHRCTYCVQTHTVVAWESGLSSDEVRALREEGPLPETFSETERAVIGFSDAISGQPARAVVRLRPYFPDYQIVELVTLAGATIFLNRFATALGLPTSAAVILQLKEAGLA